ncbi:MAG: hypothetical protein R3B09_26375 [Nannocystaceae bacterium]
MVGKHGQAVVAALEGVLSDRLSMDNVVLAKLLEHLWRKARGVPCLAAILGAISQPQLPTLDSLMSQFPSAETTLDLVVQRSAQRAVIAGMSTPIAVVSQILRDVVVRHAVVAKGGLLERVGADVLSSRMSDIHSAIDSVVRIAAERLTDTPGAIELKISSRVSAAPNHVDLSEVLA